MEEEEVVPRLPTDLVFECLVRLHYKTIPVASLVCRKWVEFIKSPQFYRTRKQLGRTNPIACFLQKLKSSEQNVINMFDPVSWEWNQLLPLPDIISKAWYSFNIISSQGKLIVMGNLEPMNSTSVCLVFVYDFATCKWFRGKDMPLSKRLFAIAAKDCRVYIAGGLESGVGINELESGDGLHELDSSWVYDVRSDEWSELPRMGRKRARCKGVIIDDEFWVTSVLGHVKSYEIYNIESREWRYVERDLELVDCGKKCCVGMGEDGLLLGNSCCCSKFGLNGVRLRFRGSELGDDRSLVIGFKRYFEEIKHFLVFVEKNGRFERMNLPAQINCYGVTSSCYLEL